MATTVVGPLSWECTKDKDGYIEYRLMMEVESDRTTDGPTVAMETAGLPKPGDPWVIDGDRNLDAFCLPTVKCSPYLTNEPNTHFKLEYTFSTKPLNHCQDDSVSNPLLKPFKISGGLSKYNEEATFDRRGNPIVNSAHEQIRGPQVEFDANRDSVKIEQNVADLQLYLLSTMRDTVNSGPMWGFPARCIKLSNYTWVREFYGTCNVYYTRTLEFETRADGFDRDVLDEGTKVLNGHWDKPTGNWIIDPIGILSFPNTPTLVGLNTGGTLVLGTTYTYTITALNLEGETTVSSIAFIELTGSADSVEVTWDAVEGATSYNVYGRESTFILKLATVTSPTYTDDGSDTAVGDPPTRNTAIVPPDPTNPKHFIRFKDRKDENCRVILNGAGLPSGVITRTTPGTATVTEEFPGSIHVEKYDESNFFLLGIPTSF